MSGGAAHADLHLPEQRALVASADTATVARLVGTLRSWGFVALVATDADGARARLDDVTAPVALALIDVRLGTELCALVRATPHLEAIPVVQFGDAATQTDDRIEGLLSGADAHLALPVASTELFAVVTALQRRSTMRSRALRTEARLRSLNSATADVHGASDRRRVIEAVVRGATAVGHRSSLLLTRDGSGSASRWSERDDLVMADPIPIDAYDAAVEPARAGQTTFVIDDPALVTQRHLAVPFIDETGEPAGVIAVPEQVEGLREDVLPMLAQLALTTSLAMANIRALDIEHRIAVTLQRSLLPQRPPEVAGLDVAFRYVAAGRQTQVGGDFYEAFALDDQRVLVAIGDVVGHSLAAATVMAEVRHAVRAYALDGSSPSEVLERVERLIRRFHRTMYTTAVLGIVDLAAGRFEFCSAGHLPIVRCGPDSTELLESHGTLLGAGRPTPALELLPLGPGDRIVMVTDGLVERRGESLDDGLRRLREAAHAVRRLPLDDALESILVATGPGAAQDDDIAMIGFEVSADTRAGGHDILAARVLPVHRPPLLGPLVTPLLVHHVALPRDRTAPACARRALEATLVGEPSRLVEDALLAVSEIVTNAVLHAGGADRMTVSIDRRQHVLRVEVHDSTRVEPNRRPADLGAPGGRGLPILDVLCRRHGARLVDDGKVVWLEIELSDGGAR